MDKYIVLTQDNKIIRNFEDNQITVYEDKRQAQMLAEILNGSVQRVTDEELKIARKLRK